MPTIRHNVNPVIKEIQRSKQCERKFVLLFTIVLPKIGRVRVEHYHNIIVNSWEKRDLERKAERV